MGARWRVRRLPLMDYFSDEGNLFEFSVLSPADGDDYVIECFGLAADGGGLVGTMLVAPDGRARLTLETAVSVRLLRRWIEFAEAEVGLAPAEPPGPGPAG